MFVVTNGLFIDDNVFADVGDDGVAFLLVVVEEEP